MLGSHSHSSVIDETKRTHTDWHSNYTPGATSVGAPGAPAPTPRIEGLVCWTWGRVPGNYGALGWLPPGGCPGGACRGSRTHLGILEGRACPGGRHQGPACYVGS